MATVNIAHGQFPFTHGITHRMAQMHGKYIAALADKAGVPYPQSWPQALPKPTKPNLCELVWRTASPQQRKVIEANLSGFEQQARSEGNKPGKPVQKWQWARDTYERNEFIDVTDAPVRSKMETINVEDIDELMTSQFNRDMEQAQSQEAQSQEKQEKQEAQSQEAQSKEAQSQEKQEREQRKQEREEKKAQQEQEKNSEENQKRREEMKRNPLYDAVRDVVLDVLEENPQSIDEEYVNDLIAEQMDTLEAKLRSELNNIAQQSSYVMVKTHNTVTHEIKDAGVQHRLFPTLVKLMQCGFPIWIPGPAGSGKTTAVNNACKALEATLYMPPEGPIENKYGMIGYMQATGDFVETTLYHAAKEAAANPDKLVVYFIDECDAGYANALMVLNAVMENGYCTFANGERVHYGRNLMFIAGANTYGNGATNEYVGRNKLDAATLDRFITLAWEYDEELERAIAGDDAWVSEVQKIRGIVRGLQIKAVVTPRASLRGAALLKAGFKKQEVMDMVVFKGMHADHIKNIKSNLR